MRYAAIFIGVEEGRSMRPEHWLFTIPLRLRSLFHWAQADQELDDELRDHLARKTEEYVVQGMTQEEAHRRARLDLGGGEKVKEECRDARRVNWIQDLIRSEEHTSELQSRRDLVCRLLLEKKNESVRRADIVKRR